MDAVAAAEPREREPGGVPSPVLRTLVMCELDGGTALVERLGDRAAVELFQRHDQLGRAICARHGGREIDRSDGFLLLFERPAQALDFALDYQQELRGLAGREGQPLRARIGIHVGDVLLIENPDAAVAQGARRVDVEGLVKPVTARLMALALPGQILMSGMAWALAHRAENALQRSHPGLRVKFHGRYVLKGIPQPVPVHEAGQAGVARFLRPPSGDKARRYVPWWRTPRVLAAELAAFAAFGALAGWIVTRPSPAIAFAERDWVVVADLRNLTGDASLDDSLHEAFRISLEQSRFVNVVSDLSARATLERMRRPGDTPVDRTVGAEIALREGARALILPTVSLVGDRVRVSAEVIDPQNDTTVYAEAADGVGAESALDSIDDVTQDLRGSLGEALASIQSDSRPLAKVTTENLDALRAYSQGLLAQREGRFAEALALYQRATELDPGFALAHLGLARTRISSDDRAAALADLRKAATLRDDLPPRDALYMDALLASYDRPQVMLEKWKMLGSVYPSSFGAFANYGLFAWQYTNEYAQAIEFAKKAISPHNAMRGSTHYLLGTLYLASDELDEALAQMRRAQEYSSGGLGLHHADVLAAARDFAGARARIEAGHASGVASNDVFVHRNTISYAVDEGRLDAALAAAGDAVRAATDAGPLYGRVFRLTELALRARTRPASEWIADVEAFAADAVARVGEPGDADASHAQFEALAAAWLAALGGSKDVAARALAAAAAPARDGGFRSVDAMRVAAEAQLALANGDAAAAVAALDATVDGTETFVVRVVRLDALAAAGETRRALDEAVWLATHRGRAYGEAGSLQALQPLNVLETNLALLRAAELAKALGDDAEAAAHRAAFLAAWPGAAELPLVAKRLAP